MTDDVRPRLTPEEYAIILNHRKGLLPSEDRGVNTKLVSFLKDKQRTFEEVCDFLNMPPSGARKELNLLGEERYNLEVDQGITVSTAPQQGAKHRFLNDDMWRGDVLSFGFTADNHMGSHFERLDVLNLIYDICEGENIPVVLNAGNWIDGEASFNKNEIHTKGMTKQIDYAVQHYPYREGIETWFVSGDDHEGWYNQREGVNIGEYFQMKREKAGYHDMKHLGYVEADIEINEGGFDNQAWIRVMHAGGGSAYATSYAPQKIVESLQGGEKPAVLFIGHYHKLSYNLIRNVHTVQCGATQDQSIFMRKRKIEAHVGGGFIRLYRDKNGIINRVQTEFITAFDKKFYIGDDKYWK